MILRSRPWISPSQPGPPSPPDRSPSATMRTLPSCARRNPCPQQLPRPQPPRKKSVGHSTMRLPSATHPDSSSRTRRPSPCPRTSSSSRASSSPRASLVHVTPKDPCGKKPTPLPQPPSSASSRSRPTRSPRRRLPHPPSSSSPPSPSGRRSTLTPRPQSILEHEQRHDARARPGHTTCRSRGGAAQRSALRECTGSRRSSAEAAPQPTPAHWRQGQAARAGVAQERRKGAWRCNRVAPLSPLQVGAACASPLFDQVRPAAADESTPRAPLTLEGAA